MFGPDTSSSLTVEEFALLWADPGRLAEMDAHPVDKDAWPRTMTGMRGPVPEVGAPRNARFPPEPY